MQWKDVLIDLLASYYPDAATARRIADSAGLDLIRIQFTGTAGDVWHSIVTEAQKQERVLKLVDELASDYPNLEDRLQTIVAAYRLDVPKTSSRSGKPPRVVSDELSMQWDISVLPVYVRLRRVIISIGVLLLLAASLFVALALSTSTPLVQTRNSIMIPILLVSLGAALLILNRRFTAWTTEAIVQGSKLEVERERLLHETLYLQNLVERFTREFPWEIEKYTELEALQEDIEEQARRVQPRLWALPDSEDAAVEGNLRSRVNVMQLLRDEKGPIMLKGDPGTGKTLTVRRYAVDQAKEALKRIPANRQIPLYIPLALYTDSMDGAPQPVFDFIQQHLSEDYEFAWYLREHLRDYLIQGRLLLLFDGLNELPPDEYATRYALLEEFIFKKYPKNKVVFTCRTLRHTSITRFNTVSLSELTDEQIKRFIAAYLNVETADAIYKELSTGDGFMLKIFRNPFMLQMLVRRDTDRPPPQSPAQLFSEYIQDQLQTISSATDEIISTLTATAFLMQEDGVFAGNVTYDWLERHFSQAEIQRIQRAHAVQLVDYTHEKKLRFNHQIVQEYFAATNLYSLWQSENEIEKYFDDYRWEETILVCAGIVNESEEFIQKIWTQEVESDERFWLAIKALGSSRRKGISPEYYDDIFDQAETYLGMRWRARPTLIQSVETIKAITYIDDNKTLELLVDVVTNQKEWLRELGIQSLAKSRHPQAKPRLTSAVVELKSVQILLLVAPYYSRQEWVQLIGKSAFSFEVINFAFGMLWQYLWILTPAIYFAILYKTSSLLDMNPVTLVARVLALSFLAQVLHSNWPALKTAMTSDNPFKRKLSTLSGEFGWHGGVVLIICLALWFFGVEILNLLGILVIMALYIWLLWVMYGFLKRLTSLRKMAEFLFTEGKLTLTIFVLYGLVWVIGVVFPTIRVIPDAPSRPADEISLFARYTGNIYIFLLRGFVYVYYPVLVVGGLNAILHIRIYWLYLRISKWRKEFNQTRALDKIQKVFTFLKDEKEWLPVRQKAARELRMVDNMPSQYLSGLNNLALGSPELGRELQRTVYELLSKERQKQLLSDES